PGVGRVVQRAPPARTARLRAAGRVRTGLSRPSGGPSRPGGSHVTSSPGNPGRFTHLEGAYLWSAHLEAARLVDAHLDGANLNHANLEGARLMHASLKGAHLVEAHLDGANLHHADLEGARFLDAHLEGPTSRKSTASLPTFGALILGERILRRGNCGWF